MPTGTHSKIQAANWRIVTGSGRDLHTSVVKEGKEYSGSITGLDYSPQILRKLSSFHL